jgi:hypothetical protein
VKGDDNMIKKIEDLPNIMYFGTSLLLPELKGKIYLTPYMGIASLFIHDRKLFKEYSSTRGYIEWNWSNDKLQNPLNSIHIIHNVKEYQHTMSGRVKGYIYKIDVTDIKEKLNLVPYTKDPDREVTYDENQLVKIIDIVPHTIKWYANFSQEYADNFGYGSLRKGES